MAYINGKETTMQYINGKGVMFAVRPPKIAGLFDENDTLIASWDELVNTYGMDVEKNYTKYTYNTDTASPYYVLTKKSKLAKGKKLVMGSKVTSIGDHTFRACTSLESIVIPDSVTSIGERAFYKCTSLTSIEIPNSVTSIGKCAFDSCTSLTSIEIPNSVTSIGSYAFEFCRSLTSIVIGDSVTSIGDDAFYCCYSLIEVINKSSLNIVAGSYDYGYVGCYAKYIITDESQSYLKNVDDFIFYDDGTDIYLVKYIGNDTEITLPEYDGGKEYSIYEYACYNDKITSVIMPDSVTSIGSCAFYKCTSLTSIEIPNSVTSIGKGAFYNCTSLTNISFNGTIMQWKAISKGAEWKDSVPATYVQCTDGQVAL